MAMNLEKRVFENLDSLYDSLYESLMESGTEEQKKQITAVSEFLHSEREDADETIGEIQPGDLPGIQVDAEAVRDELQPRVKVTQPKRIRKRPAD